MDALLRPYGLFIWLAVLGAAIILPTIAAIRSSKWWFLVVIVSLVTAGRFFLAVTA
jgi:1-deoxy-D-xylulose 5-phosphate reductoisomerase